MVSMKDGFDLLDADLHKGVEHRAGSEIDQDRAVTIAHDVDVAGVGKEK